MKDGGPFLLEDDDALGRTIGLAPSLPLNSQLRFQICTLLIFLTTAIHDQLLQRSSTGSRFLLFRCDGSYIRL